MKGRPALNLGRCERTKSLNSQGSAFVYKDRPSGKIAGKELSSSQSFCR